MSSGAKERQMMPLEKTDLRLGSRDSARDEKQSPAPVACLIEGMTQFGELALAPDETICNRRGIRLAHQTLNLVQWRSCCEHDFYRSLVPSWCQSRVNSKGFRGFESPPLRQAVSDAGYILRAFANGAAVLRTISRQRGLETPGKRRLRREFCHFLSVAK